MNNKCRNCGAELKSKTCTVCGAVNFEEPVSYSDFTTKKINTKKILIVAGVLFLIVIIVLIVSLFIGKKMPTYTPNSYDTTYKSNEYKCKNAKSCDGDDCIYINESGGEESIKCQNTNSWYNQKE